MSSKKSKDDLILSELKKLNKNFSNEKSVKVSKTDNVDPNFEPVSVSKSGSVWSWICDVFNGFIARVKLHRKRVAQKRQLVRMLSDKNLLYLFKKYVSGSETKSVAVDSKDGTGIRWKDVPLTITDKRNKVFAKIKLDDLIVEINGFKKNPNKKK